MNGGLGFWAAGNLAAWSDSRVSSLTITAHTLPPAFHSRNLKLRPLIAPIERYRILRWNQRSYGVERVNRGVVIITPKLATCLEIVRRNRSGDGEEFVQALGLRPEAEVLDEEEKRKHEKPLRAGMAGGRGGSGFERPKEAHQGLHSSA